MFLAGALCTADADVPDAAESSPHFTPVVVDYFFEEGCADCERVAHELEPELNNRYVGFVDLRRYDLATQTNVARLIVYGQKTHRRAEMINLRCFWVDASCVGLVSGGLWGWRSLGSVPVMEGE